MQPNAAWMLQIRREFMRRAPEGAIEEVENTTRFVCQKRLRASWDREEDGRNGRKISWKRKRGRREGPTREMPRSGKGERSERERTIGISEFLERGTVLSDLDSIKGEDTSKLLKKNQISSFVIIRDNYGKFAILAKNAFNLVFMHHS